VVLDATARVGPGDRRVLEAALEARPADRVMVVVNKVDVASRKLVMERLVEAHEAAPGSEIYPLSAVTKKGVSALVDAVIALLPEGPAYFPEGTLSDIADSVWVAEMVREALLAHVQDELPHSIACRVTEWDWPLIRVEILVERDSQKGIVIGAGGSVLKKAGIAVREQLPEGAYLELHVSIEPRWQQRRDVIERLGY
jgi:GTP-binding protein Era